MSAIDPIRIFISAGERSGDVHAANLIRFTKALRPDIEFEGFGGPRMAEAGCLLHRNMLDLSVMWTSFLGHISQFVKLIRNFYWILQQRRPRALILVDFPGLHFILARLARWRGIPVIYFICPQIWGWAPWRRRKILRFTDLLMVILPFETDLYRNPRKPVVYVGHPLADELLLLNCQEEGEALRQTILGPEGEIPPGGKIVGIFPGSRNQEVRSLLPLFRNLLGEMELDPERHLLLVSCCKPEFRPLIEKELSGVPAPVRIDEGDSRRIMVACDFALVASGTATLELAFFGKPMVVLYRVSSWAHALYRFGSVSPFISLVNILGRGEVVPERVVTSSEAGDLGRRARDLFHDTPERELCLKRLERMREEAFQVGAVERAARTLLDFFQERNLLAGREVESAPKEE